jgi:hypothetical protein
VQSFIFYLSNAIVNATFRVLYSEFIPKGSEIEWFGLQVVLSCATVSKHFNLLDPPWVSYLY